MHCLACTSTSFDTEARVKVKSVVTVLERSMKPERYSMMQDIQREFVGSYSTFKEAQKRPSGRDEAAGDWTPSLNP